MTLTYSLWFRPLVKSNVASGKLCLSFFFLRVYFLIPYQSYLIHHTQMKQLCTKNCNVLWGFTSDSVVSSHYSQIITLIPIMCQALSAGCELQAVNLSVIYTSFEQLLQ